MGVTPNSPLTAFLETVTNWLDAARDDEVNALAALVDRERLRRGLAPASTPHEVDEGEPRAG